MTIEKIKELKNLRDEQAQSHYDHRSKIFNINEFDKETIAVESWKLGFNFMFAEHEKLMAPLNKSLDAIDDHIRQMRVDGIITMEQMIKALKVISDNLKE